MFAILYRFAVIPMTLFAGVFFPVDQLPIVARWLAYVSPLWHGVELCRSATLGLPTAVPAYWCTWRTSPRGRWSATGWHAGGTHRSSRTRGPMVTTLARPGAGAPTNALGRFGAVTTRDLIAVRHSGYWLVVVSGFLEPVLYLLSIGIGVGGLVGDFHLADGTTISYAAFVAPAMLAASAMNGAMAETTFNFFAKLKWVRLYDGDGRHPAAAVRDRARGAGVGPDPGLALLGGVPGDHGRAGPDHARAGRSRRWSRRCWSGSRSGRSAWRSPP